jgi:RNA polymerase sigma-70 factor, ECF subfamily
MYQMMSDEAPRFQEEREQLLGGGDAALAEVFARYRPKLERIIEFRLDPSLRSRIDPSDVLQEAYLQISRRIGEFLEGTPVSLFVWIRQKTVQTLIDIHRTHFHRERNQPAYDYGQTSAPLDGSLPSR